MSTPFLQSFALSLTQALIEHGHLILMEGSKPEDVARDVAAYLGSRQGDSMISAASKGIISSAHVDDLFADNEEIMDIINKMGAHER